MLSPEAAREFFGRVENPVPLFDALFSGSPIGVQIYSPEGRSLFVNRAFLDTFRVAPPPEYSVLRDELAVVHGADQIMRDAFRGKAGKIPVVWYDPAQIEHVKVQGATAAAIETTLVPVASEGGGVRFVIFFFRDVTAEQELSRQKREAEDRLKDATLLIDNLLNGTKAVIYAKDRDGRLLFVNKQYGIVTGLEPSAILGKLPEEVHRADEAAQMRENDRSVLELNEHLEFEESVVHPDGSRHSYISLKFPLMDGSGRVHGICGISTDITAVRRLEKELGQARRMESLGLLAGGVAHDFNNLLGVMLLHVEAVARLIPNPSPELRLDLEHVRGAIDRAASLVRQLLAFGRKLPLSPRLLDLNRVVSDLSFMIRRLVGDGATFELSLSPSPCVVRADPVRIEQILLNLCKNARDALGVPGRVSVRSGRETLAAGDPALRLPVAPGRYIYFEVEDDGEGMEPAVLDRAFEPFFTTKEPGSGSGLGLATVFGIAQESLGNIRVRTRPGEGCCVRVYFPEAEGDALPEPVPAGALAQAGEVVERGLAVLVEDEPLLRAITARHLEFQGFRVLEAARADEVANLLRSHPGVRLLVTDVIMPRKSGPAMVQELRQEGLLDGVGVLFVSGYSSDELVRYGITGSACLEKPFTNDRLRAAVDGAIEFAANR